MFVLCLQSWCDFLLFLLFFLFLIVHVCACFIHRKEFSMEYQLFFKLGYFWYDVYQSTTAKTCEDDACHISVIFQQEIFIVYLIMMQDLRVMQLFHMVKMSVFVFLFFRWLSFCISIIEHHTCARGNILFKLQWIDPLIKYGDT